MTEPTKRTDLYDREGRLIYKAADDTLSLKRMCESIIFEINSGKVVDRLTWSATIDNKLQSISMDFQLRQP